MKLLRDKMRLDYQLWDCECNIYFSNNIHLQSFPYWQKSKSDVSKSNLNCKFVLLWKLKTLFMIDQYQLILSSTQFGRTLSQGSRSGCLAERWGLDTSPKQDQVMPVLRDDCSFPRITKFGLVRQCCWARFSFWWTLANTNRKLERETCWLQQ